MSLRDDSSKRHFYGMNLSSIDKLQVSTGDYVQFQTKNSESYYYPKGKSMLDHENVYLERIIGERRYFENVASRRLYSKLPAVSQGDGKGRFGGNGSDAVGMDSMIRMNGETGMRSKYSKAQAVEEPSREDVSHLEKVYCELENELKTLSPSSIYRARQIVNEPMVKMDREFVDLGKDKKIAELKRKQEITDKTIEHLNNHIVALSRKLESSLDISSRLQKLTISSKQTIQQLKESQQIFQEKIRILEEENSSLKNLQREWKEIETEIQQKLNASKTEASNSSTALQHQLKIRIPKAKHQKEVQTDKSHVDYETMKKTITSLQDENTQYSKLISSLRKEVSHEKSQCSSLLNRMEKRESERLANRELISDLSSDIYSLKEELSKHLIRISEYKKVEKQWNDMKKKLDVAKVENSCQVDIKSSVRHSGDQTVQIQNPCSGIQCLLLSDPPVIEYISQAIQCEVFESENEKYEEPTTPSTPVIESPTPGTPDSGPRKKSKEDYTLEEILTTEETYVKSLTICVEKYGSSFKNIMTPDQVSKVFTPVERILSLNETFLEDLREIYKNEDYHKIPPLLTRYSTLWKGIYADYIVNFDDSLATVAECRTLLNEKFKEIEKNVVNELRKMNFRNTSLKGFLVQPVQRVPRYRMLLQDLEKRTSDPVLKELLGPAVVAVDNLAKHCNEKQRERVNLLKKIELEKQFNLKDFSSSNRKFEKEGKCMLNGQPSELYLFNDIIVFAIGKKTYEVLLSDPINVIRASEKDEASIRVELPRVEFDVTFNSAVMCKSWLTTILDKRAQFIKNSAQEYVIEEGYLKKQGKSQYIFQKRYHLLTNKRMKYFDKKNGKLKGSYSIENAQVGTTQKHTLRFDIKTFEGRTYVLKVDSECDYGIWMKAFHKLGWKHYEIV